MDGYDDPIGPPRIVRHTSPFYEGVKWGVNWRSHYVLGKDGTWDYEPLPSSRDDDFYREFRFDSVEDALKTLLNSKDKEGPKRCRK